MLLMDHPGEEQLEAFSVSLAQVSSRLQELSTPPKCQYYSQIGHVRGHQWAITDKRNLPAQECYLLGVQFPLPFVEILCTGCLENDRDVVS
jgi:hypothetical protein